MTTDTPRTDAETYVWQNGGENPFVHKDFARQLERELNELWLRFDKQMKAEAEVERLDHLLADASETNHRLQAEVEKLKDERIYSY